MRTRLVVMAAAVVAWMSPGSTALAHGGHRHGSERRAEHDRSSRYSFELTGSQVPGGGDPEGVAHATLSLHPDREVVCLQANWRRLAGEVTSIHLHKAPAGKAGPHHIEILNDESLAGEWNRVEFCVKVPGGDDQAQAGGHHRAQAEGHHGEQDGGSAADRIRAVSGNPSDFYVNVHSTAFPNGAVRGQLAG
jgi:hypothetical protein